MQNMKWIVMAAAALGMAAIALPAQAQLEEVRFGVLMHDVNVTGNGAGGKEDGVNFAAELVFASPEFLSWVGSPRPFIQGSINSDGLTNFGGVGLAWAVDFTDTFYGEIDFGVSVHDGITELPPNPGDPLRIQLDATRVILGSDVLFRTVFALGTHLSDRWDAAVVFEHLSHGQILAQGRNEGLDNIGLRISYKFGN